MCVEEKKAEKKKEDSDDEDMPKRTSILDDGDNITIRLTEDKKLNKLKKAHEEVEEDLIGLQMKMDELDTKNTEVQLKKREQEDNELRLDHLNSQV